MLSINNEKQREDHRIFYAVLFCEYFVTYQGLHN